MISGFGHGDKGTNTKSLGPSLDPVHRGVSDALDADQLFRPHDIDLHQIDERRPAREKLGAASDMGIGPAGREHDSILRILHRLIKKRTHVTPPLSAAPVRWQRQCSGKRRSGKDCRSYIPGFHPGLWHALPLRKRWRT